MGKSRAIYMKHRRQAASGGDAVELVIQVPAKVLDEWRAVAKERGVTVAQLVVAETATALLIEVDGDLQPDGSPEQAEQWARFNAGLRRALAVTEIPDGYAFTETAGGG